MFFGGLIGPKYLEGKLHQLLTGESLVSLMKMESNTHIKAHKPEKQPAEERTLKGLLGLQGFGVILGLFSWVLLQEPSVLHDPLDIHRPRQAHITSAEALARSF